MDLYNIISVNKEDVKLIPHQPGVPFAEGARRFEEENREMIIIHDVAYVDHRKLLPMFSIKAKNTFQAKTIITKAFPERTILQILKVEEVETEITVQEMEVQLPPLREDLVQISA